MDDVLNMIFSGFTSLVDILQNFTFTLGGVTVSMWQFYLALFVVSALIPVLFVARSGSDGKGSGGSERTKSKKGSEADA